VIHRLKIPNSESHKMVYPNLQPKFFNDAKPSWEFLPPSAIRGLISGN